MLVPGITALIVVTMGLAFWATRWRVGGDQPGPVMRAAFVYERAADRFAEWTGSISKWIVIPTVVVGFVNVILRYVGELTGTRLTNNSLIETQWYLYSLIFLFGFAYILKHGINVRVDFWFANQTQRRKTWIDLIGHLVALIPFCVIGIWVSWRPVINSWNLRETSPDPDGLLRYPIKAMIIVGFVLLLIQAIAELIRVIAILRGLEGYVEVEKVERIRVE